MNFNRPQMKRGRKIAYLCHRQISSTSNKSQLSHSHIAVTAGYKKRISTLLKINKTLANALQVSRQELSDMKIHLETNNEHLNKTMYVQSKMLHMHSTLQSFVKDFDETLQLLKQDDTRWPTIGYIMKCRENFKNKMQNVIEPVEETSERESIFGDPEVGKCSVGNKKSSDMITSTPVASNSKKVPSILRTELDKETKEESLNLITVNEDVVDCCQENNVPAICEKLPKLNSPAFGDFVLKIPVLPALACGESNGPVLPNDDEKKNSDSILPEKEMYISAMPALSISCPPVKSIINLNSTHSSTLCHPFETSLTSSTENMPAVSSVPSGTLLSVKTKYSKIPRFQDLSVDVKTKPCLFNIASEEKPSCAKKLTKKNGKTVFKSNSDICQRMPFSENIEIPSESTNCNFNNECSNHERILTAVNREVTGVEDFHRRKTFVVKKSESVSLVESQSNRRKTFVKKTCKTDRKSPISNGNKRKTFIVTEKNDVDESVNNDKNCSTVVSASGLDNNAQNQNVAHSLVDIAEISSVLSVAPVLNAAISTSSAEEFKNNSQSTEMLTDKNKILATNHFRESQSRDEHILNRPLINYVEVPSIFCNRENGKEFDSSLQSTERFSARNSLQDSQESDQNKISVPKISYSEGALVMPTEIKCNDFPVDLNVTHTPDQNIFLESEINIKKENEEKVIESAEPNLQKCSAGDLHGDGNLRNEKEFNQGSDILNTWKLKGNSLTRHKQKVSCNFKSSPDSEDEVIYNADFDILFVKDPPIRRHISKSKPSKVFVFDANKRKSSFFKSSQNKLKPTENSLKVCDEGDIPTQSNNDIVSNVKTENIQENTANIKVQKCKKKKLSVRFAQDTYIDEDSISNTDSKTCKSKFGNSSKQPKLPEFVADGKQKAEDIREGNENMTANEVKAKVSSLCPEAETSANCQTNIFSNYTNISIRDQNECIINYNRAKSGTSDAIVKMQCSDMENKERKPKKLKRKKQISLSDSIPLDDCLSIKKSKLMNSKRIDEDVNSQEITLVATEKNGNFGSKHAKKKTISKEKNVKKKVNKLSEEDISCKNAKKETKSKEKKVEKKANKFSEEDIPFKNTIIVHAEIHPPPPFVNRLPFASSCKENIEIGEIKHKQLSVVLSDVFQSKDIINLNISCDKEYLLSKENTHLPSKTPLSENSSNTQITAVVENATETAHDSHCVDEIKTYRRRRIQNISYKEPSLILKMRR